jgi:hypothetical protein
MQAGTQAGKQAGRQAGRQVGRQAGREAGRHAGKQAGRQGCRQAGRQAGKQGGRQGGRQAGRHAGRQAALRLLWDLRIALWGGLGNSRAALEAPLASLGYLGGHWKPRGGRGGGVVRYGKHPRKVQGGL